ncbi:glycine cleavage system aminomethyltransferase GcvT [Haliea sp. E17]|uniref:glycine cleavage system aminomethyltransferase GcvT n=1 Tax=Haliea sp. E17 TaxID=3401576 RepID=UPI003AAC8D00
MSLKTTPLNTLHRELGAKMVPFAGYDMPVQYPTGIIREHQHTRDQAGLFDVSHMGQVVVSGPGAAAALERLLPADLEGLGEHRQTYSLLTNGEGGVRDDLIVTRWGPDTFFLVVNAACKEQDIAYLRENLPGLEIDVLEDRALLALQGPQARAVMAELCPGAAQLVFLQGARLAIEGVDAYVTSSGYTGEDGFELSVPAASADAIARSLLAQPAVEAIGLGARDSLRLEAGLCLYGHELTETTDPVQAGLAWAIAKARRVDGARPGGFPGADVILDRLQNPPSVRRVGLVVDGKRPVRDGQSVINAEGDTVGDICSAAFGATLGGPIAMAYLSRDYAEPGTQLAVDVRGKQVPVTVTRMPFVPQRYYRG